MICSAGWAGEIRPEVDLTGDCRADVDDLAALIRKWLTTGANGGDFDLSGTVNLDDFSLLSGQWLSNWGWITVTIEPGDVNGQWQIDGGEWRATGEAAAIEAGREYVIAFRDIGGWNCPSDESINLSPCQNVQLSGTYTVNNRDVIISEFMAVNSDTLSTVVDGETINPDWIELHNRSAVPVNLLNWALTDDSNNKYIWRLPEIILDPGDYLLIFASDMDRQDDLGYYHTNFKLTSQGEHLALLDPELVVIHAYDFPKQINDVSYGIYDGVEHYFSTPTPEEENSNAVDGIVGEPVMNFERGYYNEPIAVELASATDNAVIRYTLDGSKPSINHGLIYTGPIGINTTTCLRAVAIRPGWLDSRMITHTYLYIDSIVTQTKSAGWPDFWEGYEADYDMDPEICQSPRYSGQMEEALKALPVVSIVTDLGNLFDEESGIYVNPYMNGDAWERAVSVEFFDGNKNEEFQINCGLRIHGKASRDTGRNPKHGLRLCFRSEYGAKTLAYPVFGDEGVDEFNCLVLRSEWNFGWLSPEANQRDKAQYARDQWARKTQMAMGWAAADGRFVHLYLNGVYWGLYILTERPDGAFAAEHFGGDAEDYDAINSGEAIDGDLTAWHSVQAIANAILDQGSCTKEQYLQLEAAINIDNFIDYILLNLYNGNVDWDQDNWYAIRHRNAEGKFMFFCWDSEYTLDEANSPLRLSINNNGKPSRLFSALKLWPAFRERFSQRARLHLFDNGALTAEAASLRWEALTETIKDAVTAESARWGDYRRDVHPWEIGPFYLYTTDVFWEFERDRLIYDYFPLRHLKVLDELIDAELYSGEN